MVRRLIIDDIRSFTGGQKDDVTVHARTMEFAREQISSAEWDEVWFDYDMGKDITTKSLADDIEAGKVTLKGDPVIVIHTGNPVGRAHIVQALADKYRIQHVIPGGYGG